MKKIEFNEREIAMLHKCITFYYFFYHATDEIICSDYVAILKDIQNKIDK